MTNPLAEPFKKTFRTTATHVVKAPGRVNLIGEHLDYNGLPVLPMAIQRRVEMVFRSRDDEMVRLANATSSAYDPMEFRLSRKVPRGPAGDWENYPKAAGQALTREFGLMGGLDGLVASNLPVAVGLSSSAALVVAVALAIMEVNIYDLEPGELAELLAEGERYVGTRGGAMDQAVCLLAEKGTASRIEFDPLSVTHVPIPDDWRFVVASTLVKAEKSGAAKEAYNARTRECAEALEAVAPRVDADDPPGSYSELLERVDSTDELVAMADEVMNETLLRRFRHVVTEARRVREAEEALRAGELAAFGSLLDASHRSLRNDYEVSSPELDELLRVAWEGGAAGARLTGAGFGGCILAVCRKGEDKGLIAALDEAYYAKRDVEGPLKMHRFVAKPRGGAAVEPL